MFNKHTKLSNPAFDSSPIAEDDQEYEPMRYMPTPQFDQNHKNALNVLVTKSTLRNKESQSSNILA